jgi:glycosyltransferase involved in cell wall biosynthesis
MESLAVNGERNLRVLLATSFPVPGEYDGTAMLPIKILRALKTRGVEPILAHLRARPPWGPIERTEFEGTPSFTLPPSAWISGLKRIHDEFPFDIVHAQHHGGANRAQFACRKYRRPMIYEIHSLLGEEVEREKLGRGLAFRVNVMLERWACRTAKEVIVLGELVKRVCVEEKGIPAERVHVIYPGIDLSEYEHSDNRSIAIPGIESHHKVFMYIGSIVHPNQGVPLLIDAATRVFDAIPDARCVLTGGPEEAGEGYRQKLGRHGDKLIVLAGRKPDEVVGLSRRADVLVHPRLECRENYSVQSKIAVYLAAGRPIVATDFADYKTILGDSGAGRLCKAEPGSIAEAIIDVLEHPELAQKLAANTAPVARELFGMDRNIDRYLDVYRKALAQNA